MYNDMFDLTNYRLIISYPQCTLTSRLRWAMLLMGTSVQTTVCLSGYTECREKLLWQTGLTDVH